MSGDVKHHFAQGTELVWGCPQKSEFGVVQSYSENNQGDVAEGRNEDGNVISTTDYNLRKEVSMNVLAKENVTLPESGDTIESHDGKMIIVRSANVAWTNQGYKSIDITGIIYPLIQAPSTPAPPAPPAQ